MTVGSAEGVFAATFGDVTVEEGNVVCCLELVEPWSKDAGRMCFTANAEVGGLGGDDGGGEGDCAVCRQLAVRLCHGASWLRG